MKNSSSIGIIILAAGASTRLGRPKQLLDYKGKPLLQHVIDVIESIENETSVLVLGANAKEILKLVDSKTVTVELNEQWMEGMASSIRTGLTRILQLNPKVEHILFLVGDQPHIAESVLQQLIDSQAANASGISASFYDNQMGVPAIFGKAFFSDLMKLKGDQGAKKIINKHLKDVRKIPFKLGAIDIDSKADYDQLKRNEL